MLQYLKRSNEAVAEYSNKTIYPKFSLPITQEIYEEVIAYISKGETGLNEAIELLLKIAPDSIIPEGKYKGCNSLILIAQIQNNSELLSGLYNKVISYPGVNVNATCTAEGPDKGKSVLWIAIKYGQWKLVDKLITAEANINATCTGEGPDKGKSVL